MDLGCLESHIDSETPLLDSLRGSGFFDLLSLLNS